MTNKKTELFSQFGFHIYFVGLLGLPSTSPPTSAARDRLLAQTAQKQKTELFSQFGFHIYLVGLLGLPSTSPPTSAARDRLLAQTAQNQKTELFSQFGFHIYLVGLLGLEPRLFWTKTRRVASYTIGHCCNADANLKQSFSSAKIFTELFKKILPAKNGLFECSVSHDFIPE